MGTFAGKQVVGLLLAGRVERDGDVNGGDGDGAVVRARGSMHVEPQ